MTVRCGKDICLRELEGNDPNENKRILEIIRACAVRSTRKLYISCKDENYKNKMKDMFEEKVYLKLIECFNFLDHKMENEEKPHVKEQIPEYIKKIEAELRYVPDDHLFSAYGPIQQPFKDSVQKFLDKAIDEKEKKEGREMYRMGIRVGAPLIGCFTIDFGKHNYGRYPVDTTGDPGIFIMPGVRENFGIRRWQEVLSMATAIVEKFYNFEENDILIGVTAHPANVESENILSEENGFKEFPGGVVHDEYGKRRFFTINHIEFIDKFKSKDPYYQPEILLQ